MRIAIIAALFAATAALAAPQAVWKDGTTRTYWPSRIAWPDGRETIGANVAQVEASGEARPETKQEQAAREKSESDSAKAAQAAADAEAKAAAADKAFKAAKLESAAKNGAKAKDADTAAALAEIIEVLKEKK